MGKAAEFVNPDPQNPQTRTVLGRKQPGPRHFQCTMITKVEFNLYTAKSSRRCAQRLRAG
jgi:hypothetical protein